MPDPAEHDTALQRAIAERSREFAAGNHRPRSQRYWQYGIALAGALLIVALVFFGFDTFLTSMQKLLEIMGAEPTPTEPMPVFMVPESPASP